MIKHNKVKGGVAQVVTAIILIIMSCIIIASILALRTRVISSRNAQHNTINHVQGVDKQ